MGQDADTDDNTVDDGRPRAKRRRGSRRVTVAGTGPDAATGPEPRIESIEPKTKQSKTDKLSERERWMLEQRPPHY